jgi:hypothetical protein
MPTLFDSKITDVVGVINWAYGKENDSNASIAALATHIRSRVRTRPAKTSDGDIPWQTIADLRYAASVIGPSVTNAQFDTALAAYVAS